MFNEQPQFMYRKCGFLERLLLRFLFSYSVCESGYCFATAEILMSYFYSHVTGILRTKSAISISGGSFVISSNVEKLVLSVFQKTNMPKGPKLSLGISILSASILVARTHQAVITALVKNLGEAALQVKTPWGTLGSSRTPVGTRCRARVNIFHIELQDTGDVLNGSMFKIQTRVGEYLCMCGISTSFCLSHIW